MNARFIWNEGDIVWLRTLYVNRRLLNAGAIRAWAREQGFESTLPASEMHVTLAYSKEPVDWSLLTPMQDAIVVMGDGVEKMNPNHAPAGSPEGGQFTSGDRSEESNVEGYHATSSVHLESIATNGISPQGGAGSDVFWVKNVSTGRGANSEKGKARAFAIKEKVAGNKGYVFFSTSSSGAATFALFAQRAAGGKGAVLKLRIPKSAFDKFGSADPDSVRSLGAFRFKGKIDPSWIEGVVDYSQGGKVKPLLRVKKAADDAVESYVVVFFPEAVEKRSVEQFDGGAVVLRLRSEALQQRWQELVDAGAHWKYDEYHPHVTITYEGGDVDLASVEPYAGVLVFGPEEFAEVVEGGFDPDDVEEEVLKMANRRRTVPRLRSRRMLSE